MKYDAIIVGARVGGSATASSLARRGHRVLLVDKASFPSDTISSHLVKPRAIAYLDRWGLRPALEAQQTDFRVPFTFNCEGFAITGHATRDALRECLARDHGWDDVSPLPDGPIEWACIRRTVLDKTLVDAARDAGVEVREGFRVSELIRDDAGRVLGIRGGDDDRDDRVEERAEIVIGADGRHSLVARAVEAEVLRESLACGYTYYAYYQDIDLQGLELGVHLRGRLGLGYCPTNHGQVMISVWGPREWAPGFRQNVERNFVRAVRWCYPELADRIAAGVRETRFYGMLEQPNRVRRLSGPGWALVGDAGYQVDQCTAIGITHAFRGAEWLAADLHEGLAGTKTIDEAAASYERRVLDSLDGYFDHVCRVARMEPPSLEQVGLFEVLSRSSELASRFFNFGASLISYHDFHGPEGRELIRAKGGLPDPASIHAYEQRRPSYERNPWAP
jgi:flavin-dependent dehydrogenase